MALSVGTESSFLPVPGGADASGRRAAMPAITAVTDFATLMQVAGGEMPGKAVAGAMPPAGPEAKTQNPPQPALRRAALTSTALPWDMIAAAAEETGLLAGQFQQAMRIGAPRIMLAEISENPPEPAPDTDASLVTAEPVPVVDMAPPALPLPPVLPAVLPVTTLQPAAPVLAPAAAMTATLPRAIPQQPEALPGSRDMTPAMATTALPSVPSVSATPVAEQEPALVATAAVPFATTSPAPPVPGTVALEQRASQQAAADQTAFGQTTPAPAATGPAALAMAAPLAAASQVAVLASQPTSAPRPAEARRPAPAAGVAAIVTPAEKALSPQALRPVEAMPQDAPGLELKPDTAAQPDPAPPAKAAPSEDIRFTPPSTVPGQSAELTELPLTAPPAPLPAEAAWRPEVVRPLSAPVATAIAPLSRPQQTADAAQQVALQAASAAADGVETISVDLRPPELGRVELRLTFQDGTVQITMAAERAETFEAFRNDRAQLEQQMQQAGLQLGGGGLDLQHGRLPREAPEQAHRGAGTPDAGTGDDTVDTVARPRPRSDSLIDLIA